MKQERVQVNRKMLLADKFKKLFPEAVKDRGPVSSQNIPLNREVGMPDKIKPMNIDPIAFEFPKEVDEKLASLDNLFDEDDIITIPEVPPRDGEFIMATTQKVPVQIQHYKNGKLHGEMKIFENGQLVEKIPYVKGVVHGEKRYYTEEGQLTLIENYRNGKRNGLLIQLNENGSPLLRSQYKDEKLEGLMTQYTENGELQSKIHYKANKKHGPAHFFYPQQNPEDAPKIAKTIHYAEDKQHGEAVTYYQSGKPMMKEHYEKGRLHGGVVEYYENGQVRKITKHENGKPVAPPVMYDIKGRELKG